MKCRINELEGRHGDTTISLDQVNEQEVNVINNMAKKTSNTGESSMEQAY